MSARDDPSLSSNSQEAPAESKPEVPKVSVRQFIASIEPSFVTGDVSRILDRASGLDVDEDEEPEDFGFPGMAQPEPASIGRVRELLAAYFEAKKKYDALREPPDFETLLLKEYRNDEKRLRVQLDQAYADLVATADYAFNESSAEKSAIKGVTFLADRNREVTVTKIMDLIGPLPELPAPEQWVNPSRVAPRAK